MCATEWRLALLAVLLRAPLLTQLAVLAGRTVGLYGALQQHTLNQANAYAAEALAQPLVVATAAMTAHSAARLRRLKPRPRDGVARGGRGAMLGPVGGDEGQLTRRAPGRP